eukprot:4630178-Prymnesium_polylepis.1
MHWVREGETTPRPRVFVPAPPRTRTRCGVTPQKKCTMSVRRAHQSVVLRGQVAVKQVELVLPLADQSARHSLVLEAQRLVGVQRRQRRLRVRVCQHAQRVRLIAQHLGLLAIRVCRRPAVPHLESLLPPGC